MYCLCHVIARDIHGYIDEIPPPNCTRTHSITVPDKGQVQGAGPASQYLSKKWILIIESFHRNGGRGFANEIRAQSFYFCFAFFLPIRSLIFLFMPPHFFLYTTSAMFWYFVVSIYTKIVMTCYFCNPTCSYSVYFFIVENFPPPLCPQKNYKLR